MANPLLGDIFFSNEFLEPRPLLKAIREENGCVLLIDEIDKADHEFESLLLEIYLIIKFPFRDRDSQGDYRTANRLLNIQQYQEISMR